MEKYYSASPKSDAKPIPLLVPVVNADFIFLCISVVVQRSSDQNGVVYDLVKVILTDIFPDSAQRSGRNTQI